MTDQKAVARVVDGQRAGESFRVMVGGIEVLRKVDIGMEDARDLCESINSEVSQTHVPRSEAEALREEVDRAKKEIESLIWNLGGCDTYALGYNLDEGHSKEMARPALESVRRLALRYRDLRRVAELMREALGAMQMEAKARNCGLRIADEAIAAFDQIEKESGNGGHRDGGEAGATY